jgi:hypothetical protein
MEKSDHFASAGAEPESLKPYYSHCFAVLIRSKGHVYLAGLSPFRHVEISFTFGSISPSSFRLMQCLPSSLYVSSISGTMPSHVSNACLTVACNKITFPGLA